MTALLARFSVWAHTKMPTREQMEHSRWIPKRVLARELWRFTRRSVPRGVAVGLFFGIFLPGLQVLFATALSIGVRANVPVAALTTIITNPFTTPFIWAAGYEVGAMLSDETGLGAAGAMGRLMSVGNVSGFVHWLAVEGKVMLLGLLVLAVIASIVGYFVTGVVWRAWVGHKRKAHLSERADRAA